MIPPLPRTGIEVVAVVVSSLPCELAEGPTPVPAPSPLPSTEVEERPPAAAWDGAGAARGTVAVEGGRCREQLSLEPRGDSVTLRCCIRNRCNASEFPVINHMAITTLEVRHI